jgi:hypothetical protein
MNIKAFETALRRRGKVNSDRAASGDASKINQRDASSAARMLGHSPGLTARLLSSRNTSMARRRFHGFARCCRPRCKTGADIIGIVGTSLRDSALIR